jgi:acetylornithine deacetylase/succinyl-diaminopimelate desuccinylase-like protein
MPHDDNAVVHLASALRKLAHDGLPYHLCDAASGFLEAASRAAADTPMGDLLHALKSPVGAERAFQIELQDHELRPFLYAMVHNTATPTGLKAGIKTNVIPALAEATIDGRVLPGFNTGDLLAELNEVIGEGFETEVILESPPLETPHDTPLFELMSTVLREHDAQATAVLPYMMSGATDAKYLAMIGVPTYGFAPLQLPGDMRLMEMFHAHDERAPVEGLGWGVRVLYDVVKRYCS